MYPLFLFVNFWVYALASKISSREPATAIFSLPPEGHIVHPPSQNLSASKDVEITCNPNSPFDSETIADCRDAKEYLGVGNELYTWHERKPGSVTKIVNLPYRVMGSPSLFRRFFGVRVLTANHRSRSMLFTAKIDAFSQSRESDSERSGRGNDGAIHQVRVRTIVRKSGDIRRYQKELILLIHFLICNVSAAKSPAYKH